MEHKTNIVSRPSVWFADENVEYVAEAHHYEKTMNCQACGEDSKKYIIFRSQVSGRPDPKNTSEMCICKQCISDASAALAGLFGERGEVEG